MSKLAACLAKAGKLISPAEAEALLRSAAEIRAMYAIDETQAEHMAVGKAMSSLHGDLQTIAKLAPPPAPAPSAPVSTDEVPAAPTPPAPTAEEVAAAEAADRKAALDEKIAYLDEQLATKEISKEMHAEQVAQARMEAGLAAPEPEPTPVAPPEPIVLADAAPKRIAKTTSNDLKSDNSSGGWFAVALEAPDGTVHWRNVYENHDKTEPVRRAENAAGLLPDVKGKGTGRNLKLFEKLGWIVHGPFALARRIAHLQTTQSKAEFLQQTAAHAKLVESISTAMDEGRQDTVIEEFLKAHHPAAWAAVQHIRDFIAAELGSSPAQVLIGLGTRINSKSDVPSERARVTLQKLAEGKALRMKDGKVLGVFTPEEWTAYEQAVQEGRGDDALLEQWADETDPAAAFKKWGEAIANLGEADQASPDMVGKGAGSLASRTVPLDEKQAKKEAKKESGATVVNEDAPLPTEDDPSGIKGDEKIIKDAGIADRPLLTLLAQKDLPIEYIHEQLATAAEFEQFRKTVKRLAYKRPQLFEVVRAISRTHEARRNGAAGSERRGGVEGGVRVVPGENALRSQPVEPLADAKHRASETQLAKNWNAIVGALSDLGISVRAVRTAIDSVDAFYRSTGGRTDGRRLIELVLRDLLAPTGTDVEVAAHEAVHVLFETLPTVAREAIYRAIGNLKVPATNLSLNNPDPVVRLKEKLAVLLEKEGLEAGLRTGVADRIVRFLSDMYLRMAGALARVFGFNQDADAIALRHFRNRVEAMLNGDWAPQSLANALGGRPLTFAEKAGMLPGFGKEIGRVLGGEIQWSPKVPDTMEAVAFNGELAYSQPTPLTADGNKAHDLNIDVAVHNHALAVEQAVLQAFPGKAALAPVINAALNGGLDVGRWFRAQFHFEDPNALKAATLQRIDPATGQPISTANPGQTLADFKDAINAAPAKIAALVAARKRLTAITKGLIEKRAELQAGQYRRAQAQKTFLDAHRNYLNAEGMTALVHKGVRTLVREERKLEFRTGSQVGAIMQQLRELDAREAKLIDRAYAPVFANLFKGQELRGRNLFTLLDQLVNEAQLDLTLPIKEIRERLAQRVAAGMASPEVSMLTNSTDSSRALLATVVAYAKANETVTAQIAMRRLKNIQQRTELQTALDELIANRYMADQELRELPKTAKLEERAKILYQLAKKKDNAQSRKASALEQAIAAAEVAQPVYAAAVEELQRDIGVMPEYTFGEGMTYPVPVTGPQGVELKVHTLQLSDRKAMERDAEAMTLWLGMKEAAGELDAQYRDVKAARDELLRGGYWESWVGKTENWVRGNIFMPEGEKAKASGLPIGRAIWQWFNDFAAAEDSLRAEASRQGIVNIRLRNRAIDVLNRGRKDKTMTADRYKAQIAEPAISIMEKAGDLLEQGLTPEQVNARKYQRALNHLLNTPGVADFIRGKEQDFLAALRAHLEAVEKSSAWWNAKNAEHGLLVRDQRIVDVTKADGDATLGMRPSMAVGPMTISRGGSDLIGRTYRMMVEQKWGGFKELVAKAAAEYGKSPNALRAALAEYLTPQIIDGFIAPMASNDTHSMFMAPRLADGVTQPEADAALAAKAWRDANNDVVAFIENLYREHNGTGDKGQFVTDTLQTLEDYRSQLSEMLDRDATGMQPDGLARLAHNRMIDARVMDRWPTAWTNYKFFETAETHQMARDVAAQIAFGRDTEKLAQAWVELETKVGAIKALYESIVARETNLGYRGKKLDRQVEADYVARLGAAGKAEYERAKRVTELAPAIGEARENIRTFFSSKTNRLDVTRHATMIGQTMAFGMLNNPGSALMNLADMFGPLARDGVISRETLKQVARNWKHMGEGMAGSLAQAVGINLLKSSRLQNLYVADGFSDADAMLQYIAKTDDGMRSDLANTDEARGQADSMAIKVMRAYQRVLSVGVTQMGDKSRFTVLRPLAPFKQGIVETLRASTLSTWQRVEDMVQRSIAYLDDPANAQNLNGPTFKLTAAELGMTGNEATAFESMRTLLADGYGLELTALAREAMALRNAGGRPETLSKKTRAVLHGLVASQLLLEGNLSTMTAKAWNSGTARLVLPLLGWPIRRAMQVAKIGLDSEDNYRIALVGRGLAALGLMAAGGLGMALLAEEYHEDVLGRKRNLRSVKGLPGTLARGQTGEAFLTLVENVNRAGTFGMFGEVMNMANSLAGGGDNRTLSLDQRVVMANSLFSLGRSVSAAIAQHEIDYAGVVRPMFSALGGNSALQYAQFGNRLLGLDNAEARFIERLDTQNRLRVAGREAGLEVRTGGGAQVLPTPLTPVVTRMVLAAYGGDRADFIANWREAVALARQQREPDPVAYVRDRFAERNPLKSVFRGITQDEYHRLLRTMDEHGRSEVQDAVRQFNRYAVSLDAKEYTGVAHAKKEHPRMSTAEMGDLSRRLLGF
jgi:hypothetical protein